MKEKQRRATLASVVIGLWLGGLAFLGKKELFRPHMDKLANAGLSVAPGASYFAVLQQGQQIGFASSTIDTTDGGISVHDYLVADIPVAGRTHRATARTEVNLTRKLRVTQFKMQVDAGLVPLDASGTMIGRNSARGLARWGDLSMRLGHGFAFGRRSAEGSGAPPSGGNLEFFAQADNVLNRVNFTSYAGTMTSRLFGQPTAASQARRVQVGAQLRF